MGIYFDLEGKNTRKKSDHCFAVKYFPEPKGHMTNAGERHVLQLDLFTRNVFFLKYCMTYDVFRWHQTVKTWPRLSLPDNNVSFESDTALRRKTGNVGNTVFLHY